MSRAEDPVATLERAYRGEWSAIVGTLARRLGDLQAGRLRVGPARAGRRVTVAITFDAGALIAIERRSRRMQALLDEIDRRDWHIAVPAGAVAQAWRGGPRQARIAVLLSDERTEVVALDDPVARAVGLLCGRSGHADVVDVSVALCARQRNLHVVTSDPDDLRAVDDALILHVP